MFTEMDFNFCLRSAARTGGIQSQVLVSDRAGESIQNWHRPTDLESQIIANLKENRVECALYFKWWEQTDPPDVIGEICKE